MAVREPRGVHGGGTIDISPDPHAVSRSRDGSIEPWNLAAEWAPSAGVSPHNVTLLGAFTLPAAVSATIIDVWRSAAPYNVTTGIDRFGNGLSNDRGGHPRNSGRDCGYHSLSLYASHLLLLPKLRPRIGLQVDNLLDRR